MAEKIVLAGFDDSHKGKGGFWFGIVGVVTEDSNDTDGFSVAEAGSSAERVFVRREVVELLEDIPSPIGTVSSQLEQIKAYVVSQVTGGGSGTLDSQVLYFRRKYITEEEMAQKIASNLDSIADHLRRKLQAGENAQGLLDEVSQSVVIVG